MKTIYLETGSFNPYYNLAFEEYALLNLTEGNVLILWQNDNTVVVGQNQNTEAEINRKFIEEHSINVVRRMTGGGAVYHDLGNLCYSFISDSGNAEEITFEKFSRPIIRALAHFGVRAEVSGRNDILINGRKVSGTAQRVVKGRILHHGTLLFKSNPEMIAGALNVVPEKFKSKSAKSVKSRVGNISDYIERKITTEEFWQELKELLLNDTGEIENYCFGKSDLAKIEKLKQEKYDTWEWNYGRSPIFNMKRKRYWDGGGLEVIATVEKGIVEDIEFYGDFMSVKPLDEIKEELIGKRFLKSDFSDVLCKYDMQEYFGGISMEEVLKTAFEE